jgi:ribose 5-phosphate isomerase B
MTIVLATDHAGYEQLKDLQIYLESLGHKCRNFGPKALQPNDDYPDFILPAAKAVASGEYERGIVMGGDGEGEAMAANRIKGVRCALYYGPATPSRVIEASHRTSRDPYEVIRLSRQHNDANMLSLAAWFMSLEDMKQAAKLWLEIPFSGEERHQRRISKLDQAS